MTEVEINLGREALAVGMTRRSGVLLFDPKTGGTMRHVVGNNTSQFIVVSHGEFPRDVLMPSTEDLVPILSDPATLGCLLADVRERYRDPGLSVRSNGSSWTVRGSPCSSLGTLDLRTDWTEASALVGALCDIVRGAAPRSVGRSVSGGFYDQY